MAKTKLYDNWTWKRTLPEPFESSSSVRTDVYSIYNKMSTKKSTIHSACITAILSYMEIDSSATSSPKEGAIGSQGEKTVAEYHSRTGEIHAVIFNKENGKFTAGRFQDPADSPSPYQLKDDKNTGVALFFALMPEALTDDEFKEQYNRLISFRNAGYTDMEEAEKTAAILCDNLYRRIENADGLPSAGISINIPSTGNVNPLTPVQRNKGAYAPNSVLFGNFQVLKAEMNTSSATVAVDAKDFAGKYSFSDRMFTAEERNLIPTLGDWYVIPHEVESICKHIKMTTEGIQPMRNFMLRGNAGTGKTDGAKAIATGLGLPYMHLTCSANTEIIDILGQIIPETKGTSYRCAEYPSLADIQMDPPSAYYKLTGEYQEEITEDEVYEKLIEVIRSEESQKETQTQKFQYVDTPFVTAIRNGYLIELQEPNVIANPGVLVGLNSLLDRCASITLPTGEIVKRHPDTVIIVTTNSNYAGCRNMNQSVISRMNLVIDLEELDIHTLTKRAMNVTGYKDECMVRIMAQTIIDIEERCRETMINDGSCGLRELISWIQSYLVCGNIVEAAKCTILSSVSIDPENRAEIQSTCFDSFYAA